MKQGWVMPIIFYVALVFLLKISPVTMSALVVGVYLSSIIEVPEKLLSKKMNKKYAKLVSNLLVLGAIIYSFGNIVPVMLTEGTKIFELLQKTELYNISQIEIPEWILNSINDLSKNLAGYALGVLNKLLSSLPSAFISIMIVVITTIILGTIKENLNKSLWKLFLPKHRDVGIKFLKKTYKDFGLFVKGQFIIAVFVGMFIGIASFIMGIPGALFLGILSGITNFIPYLGVVIAAIPLIMLSFSAKGLTGLIIAFVIIIVANQLEAIVIGPKVQSSNMNIHWYTLFIIIMIFGEIFGVLGIVLAIPSLMYLKNYWKYYYLKEK